MIINEGVTPPNLNGVFIATPYVLVSTYKGDTYAIGYQFSDLKLKLSDQNNANLGLTIQLKNGGSVGNGTGAFISGSNNKFTIFAEIDLVDGSSTAKQIRIFSGEIVDGTISNFYSSLHIKEKKGSIQPSHTSRSGSDLKRRRWQVGKDRPVSTFCRIRRSISRVWRFLSEQIIRLPELFH